MAKGKRTLLVTLLVGLIAYPATYALLRSTKFLVRREWLEIHPHSSTHRREVYASDVGHGSHFDADFKPKKDHFQTLFLPLWQMELRLERKIFLQR